MNFELEGFYCNKIHFNLFSRYIKFEKVQIHKKVQIIIGGIKILSAATQRHHKSSLHVLPSRYSSIHDELWELSFMELFWAMATWRLSSFTTNARASGLTPASHRRTQAANVFSSSPVLSSLEISATHWKASLSSTNELLLVAMALEYWTGLSCDYVLEKA